MGNKISRRHPVVDERYTRPQGLYEQRDFNQKKLRRLILDAKLAPCYPGVEDPATNLDECPICFMFYPSLNRSKCCMKGICTECFLQMKPLIPTRPPQCPFCKMPNYAVEYRGVKTLEEKGLEQMEEQRVIEAQIRMRQNELEEEEHRVQRRDEDPSEDRVLEETHRLERAEMGLSGGLYAGNHMGINNHNHTLPSSSLLSGSSSIRACAGSSGSLVSRSNRDEFDLDLEDIMVMEAIWLSIQDRDPSSHSDAVREGATDTLAHVSSSHNGNEGGNDLAPNDMQIQGRDSAVNGGLGLVGAIANLAERQVLNSQNVASSREVNRTIENLSPCDDPNSRLAEADSSSPRCVLVNRDGGSEDQIGIRSQESNPELNSWIEISLETGRTLPSPRRCEDSHSSSA